jgi:hypothetical protein
MKPTPGPWRIAGTMTKYIEASLGNGWVQEVASVGPTDHDNGYGQQHEANARLIAAAPDLLEALEDCLRVVEFLASDSCPTTIQNAKAALAKAAGEQQ